MDTLFVTQSDPDEALVRLDAVGYTLVFPVPRLSGLTSDMGYIWTMDSKTCREVVVEVEAGVAHIGWNNGPIILSSDFSIQIKGGWGDGKLFHLSQQLPVTQPERLRKPSPIIKSPPIQIEPLKTFSVYIQAYPEGMSNAGIIFYVGKCTGLGRLDAHFQEAATGCDCRKCLAIRSIWSAGLPVVRRIVFETTNERHALLEERRLIKVYRSPLLTNINHNTVVIE